MAVRSRSRSTTASRCAPQPVRRPPKAAAPASPFGLEKLRVTPRPPANASVNAAEGEIWDIAYLGDMTVFHVKLKSGQVVKASSLNAVRAVEEPFAYDQDVWVSFDENAGAAEGLIMRTLGSSIYQRLVIIVPYAWLLIFSSRALPDRLPHFAVDEGALGSAL